MPCGGCPLLPGTKPSLRRNLTGHGSHTPKPLPDLLRLIQPQYGLATALLPISSKRQQEPRIKSPTLRITGKGNGRRPTRADDQNACRLLSLQLHPDSRFSDARSLRCSKYFHIVLPVAENTLPTGHLEPVIGRQRNEHLESGHFILLVDFDQSANRHHFSFIIHDSRIGRQYLSRGTGS